MKRIHLVTDDDLYDRKSFYKVKYCFYSFVIFSIILNTNFAYENKLSEKKVMNSKGYNAESFCFILDLGHVCEGCIIIK